MKISTTQLKARIREFTKSNLVVFENKDQFSDDADIFKLGFVDSLFAMRLLGYLEREFDITVDRADLDIENFSSVTNMAKLVERIWARKGET
jgi:acyl carrier protein